MVEGTGAKLCGAEDFTTENNGDKKNKGQRFLGQKNGGETLWDKKNKGKKILRQKNGGKTSWDKTAGARLRGTKRIRAKDF